MAIAGLRKFEVRKPIITLIACALVLLVGSTTFAQTTKDATDKRLAAYTKTDTTKVEMLIDACVNTTFQSDERPLKWANEALQLSEKLHYSLGKIRAINCLGNYYFQRGLYDRAMQHYVDALKLAEKKGDRESIIIGKSNVGNVLTHNQKLDEGIKLFKECDRMLASGKDSLSQRRAAILTNLATALSGAGKHASAVHYYDIVYDICSKLNVGFGMALTQTNRANEFYALKEYDRALLSLAEAEKLTKELGLGFLEASIYEIYGKVWVAKGGLKKGTFYLEQSVEIAQANGSFSELKDACSQLHVAYAKTGNFEKAYATSIQLIQVKDSLFNSERNKTITELNTKYETEKKEARIASLQQEKKIADLTAGRRSLLLYVFIAVAILLAGIAYLLFNRFKLRKEHQALAAQAIYEQHISQSLLTSIKAQMNPHFFYNALNTIQAYIFSDDKRNASRYLTKFSNLTRMVLEMSEKERISLAQEIQALTLYLELEQARFSEQFTFELLVDPSVDPEMVSVPAMLIQPYVENAIKHGLLHQSGQRNLKIDFARNGSLLEVEIDDNGVGREQSAAINSQRIDKPASFSTKANEMRLDLLNRNRDQKVGVQFTDKLNSDGTSAGTTVHITIPL